MPRFTVTRTTPKSAEALWAVLADFPNIADWTSGLTASHSTSAATAGVGASRHCDLTSGATLEETIRGWDPGRELVVSIDEATKVPLRSAVSRFTIDDQGDRRTISMATEFTPKGGVFGRVLGPLLKPLFRKGNRGLLDEWEAAAATAPVAARG